MKQPVLFLMVGHAGSGKSFFAKRLLLERQAVRLNGDSLRHAIFGSVDMISKQPLSIKLDGIFNGLDYVVEQVLSAGVDVVYDSNNNKKTTRDKHRKLAEQCGAQCIVVWVQTSRDDAIARTMSRDEKIDQRKFGLDKAKAVVDRHIKNLDEPEAGENVILLDGTASSDEQHTSFMQQLKQYV